MRIFGDSQILTWYLEISSFSDSNFLPSDSEHENVYHTSISCEWYPWNHLNRQKSVTRQIDSIWGVTKIRLSNDVLRGHRCGVTEWWDFPINVLMKCYNLHQVHFIVQGIV